MKAAIYARVSTGMQVEGTSLDVQIQLCLKKADELGFNPDKVIIYREEGASGEDLERAALNNLRAEIATGGISHIIVTHPDRLSRDLTDKLLICKEFDVNSVNLVFVDAEYKTTPEGMLFFNLMSVIAQYELQLIKKRTVRGRLRAVEKDKKIMPMRVPPFGYDLINQQLVINEVEAEVVRDIYEWYVVEHLTLRQIGEKLVQMGIEPKRCESKNWSASSILNILSSEVYTGRFYYNRRKTKKIKGEKTKGGSPKKKYEYRDPEDWIIVEVSPIIDSVLYQLAREQKIKNRKLSGNTKYEYLLKSKLKCGLCGRTWDCTTYSGKLNKKTGIKSKYTCYRCPNHIPRRYGESVERCPSKTIRTELLDNYIWSLLMDVLSNPQDYIDQLLETSRCVVKELLHAKDLLQKGLLQKEKEIEKVKILFKHEVIHEEEMLNEFKRIQKEREEVNAEIKKYDIQIMKFNEEELFNENMSVVIRKVQEFIDSGGKQLDYDQRKYILDTLVDEIIVRYKEEEVMLTIVGHIGALSGMDGVTLQKSFQLIRTGPRNEKKIVEMLHDNSKMLRME
ncbi:recombinase family protein [Paenibacillus selenitireducens]|uniref:Recombinase family protein n=1 Tax=Paenibacillus selenitireducens TaxID=1324314 RepID=A0A1T2XLP4_9BACL|nr:recombinase family protein [Paenibacillus selenitireducens]OPA80583.1 recombinase family protein [Paenibacillus selenitireducens]